MGVTQVVRTKAGDGFETWDISLAGAGLGGDAALSEALPLVDEALEAEGEEPLFVPKVLSVGEGGIKASVFPMPVGEIASSAPFPLGPVKRPRVSDAEVDEGVAQLVAAHGTFATDISRTQPRMGDTVVIDVQARAAGGRVEDLSRTLSRFRVGSDELPGKVTTLLLGMRLRQSRRCELSKGWRVKGELGDGGRSRACELKVTLRDILRLKAPELTDAWVAEHMPNAGSVKGLRAIVRRTLEDEAERKAHDELLQRAAAQAAGRVTSRPDHDAVAAMAQSSMEGLLEQVHGGGYTLSEYLTSRQTDEAGLRQMLGAQASSELSRLMALDAIARENALEPADDDFDQAARSLGQAGIESPREALSASLGRVFATQQARRACANEWLLERQGLGR